MTDEIKKGDVVFLKSDVNHRMTVGSIGKEEAQCFWSVCDSGEKDIKTLSIPMCVLKKVQSSSK